MLFAFLISSVAQLSGPVTRYETFPMTEHVHAEYIHSENGACTIAASFKRRGDETTLSYEPVLVTSEAGAPVRIITMEGGENVAASRIPRGFSATVILPGTDTRGSVEPDVATSYIIEPGTERFTYSVSVQVETVSGTVTNESATVYCDAARCRCSTKGFEVASR